MAGRDDKPKRENKIQRFFRDTIAELKKVTWPSRQETWRLTLIVIFVLIFMALFLGLVDGGASALLKLAVGG